MMNTHQGHIRGGDDSFSRQLGRFSMRTVADLSGLGLAHGHVRGCNPCPFSHSRPKFVFEKSLDIRERLTAWEKHH
jgi:hypothetical protein